LGIKPAWNQGTEASIQPGSPWPMGEDDTRDPSSVDTSTAEESSPPGRRRPLGTSFSGKPGIRGIEVASRRWNLVGHCASGALNPRSRADPGASKTRE